MTEILKGKGPRMLSETLYTLIRLVNLIILLFIIVRYHTYLNKAIVTT